MSESLSNDLLEFEKLLKKTKMISSIPNAPKSPNFNDKDIDFSEIEKQMNLNAASNHSQSLQYSVVDELNQKVFTPLDKYSTIIPILDNPDIDIGEIKPMLKTEQSLINISNTNSTTQNTICNRQPKQHQNERSSYDSSPDSNFSYTPSDSLGSCTSESTVGQELVELNDQIFNNKPSSKIHSNSHEFSQNTNHHTDNPRIAPHLDTTEKFMLEQFSIDKEIEQMITSSTVSSLPSLSTSHIELTSPTLVSNKRPSSHLEGNVKKSKRCCNQEKVLQSNLELTKIRKCFSVLKSNYIELCETHNSVVDRLAKSEKENCILRSTLNNTITEKEKLEDDKDRFQLKNEEMKAILDSLLHEIITLRSKSTNNKLNCTL